MSGACRPAFSVCGRLSRYSRRPCSPSSAEQYSGEWVSGLIGVGDLPLSARDVREALLNSGLIPDQRTTASYREIASTEVVADDDRAARLVSLT